jgi:hypothetical protein
MIHGKDKEGRPLIIIQPKYHYPDLCNIELTFKFQFFYLNKLLKKAHEGKYLNINKIISIYYK